MALPRIIEFIQSLGRPGGGYLSEPGGGQIIVNGYPPGFSTSTTIFPLQGVWGMICYYVSFGMGMVPGAFSGSVQHGGGYVYSGTLTQTTINNGLNFYALLTDNMPLRVTSQNNSALAQYFEALYHFCVVNSKEDYELILGALKDMANTGYREALKIIEGINTVGE